MDQFTPTTWTIFRIFQPPLPPSGPHGLSMTPHAKQDKLAYCLSTKINSRKYDQVGKTKQWQFLKISYLGTTSTSSREVSHSEQQHKTND